MTLRDEKLSILRVPLNHAVADTRRNRGLPSLLWAKCCPVQPAVLVYFGCSACCVRYTFSVFQGFFLSWQLSAGVSWTIPTGKHVGRDTRVGVLSTAVYVDYAHALPTQQYTLLYDYFVCT